MHIETWTFLPSRIANRDIKSYACRLFQLFQIHLWSNITVVRKPRNQSSQPNFYGKFVKRGPSGGILLLSQMSMVFQFWLQCVFLPRVRNYINQSKHTISLCCIYPWPYLGKELDRFLCDFTWEKSFLVFWWSCKIPGKLIDHPSFLFFSILFFYLAIQETPPQILGTNVIIEISAKCPFSPICWLK